ncbi:hypothetical protein PCA31118_00068 [Pandoraea captiosa]|uniref:Uncharacterized protein n=1 Tax=Pandoraea captiosa TaxID=2508302 RepID=A0A5E4ZHT5_9BURK|nr:hypothetical protein PCA31118_00068 [Pandoraea captiosa]
MPVTIARTMNDDDLWWRSAPADGRRPPLRSTSGTERLQYRSSPVGQLRVAPTLGGLLEHHQLSFEQRIKLCAVHVDLFGRMPDQHQSGKFVWT